MPESEQTTRLRIEREKQQTALTIEQIRAVRGFVGDFRDLTIEVIRTASSSPLMSACLGVILANVLQRAGVIDQPTALLIDGLITATFGVDMAADLISGITSITHVSGSSPQPDLAKPSGLFFAYGLPSGATEALGAAISKKMLP